MSLAAVTLLQTPHRYGCHIDWSEKLYTFARRLGTTAYLPIDTFIHTTVLLFPFPLHAKTCLERLP